MTSRRITEAEVRHQQKSLRKREIKVCDKKRENVNEEEERNPTDRERERETERERERERERELGILSMVRFDSPTSSFLALLVIKSYRNLNRKKQNLKD